MVTALTLEQKRTLYRDGYIILWNAVSKDLVEAARQRIRTADEGQILCEEGNNPWEWSKHAMCNMWHEWDGMQEVGLGDGALQECCKALRGWT